MCPRYHAHACTETHRASNTVSRPAEQSRPVRALRLAGAIAVAYIAFMLLLTTLQDRLIFFPTRGGKVTGPGIDVELHADDGTRLHARYIERAGATHTLLYLHGNAGNLANRSDLLEQFAEFGAHVLALEYRGYGQSEGEPSERGLYSDARAAYDWAVARTPAKRLVIFGESLGGGPACELASTREAGGLILLSTFTGIADMAARQFPWLPVRWLVRTRFDNLEKIARVRAPKLFIHSRTDEVVPFEMGPRLFAAASEPKTAVWLDTAGHNETFYSQSQRVTRAIKTFLQGLPD